MTELEWLKQESGLSDEELKPFEAVLGTAQFKTMLTKVMGAKDAASAQVATAEQERINLENQWKDVYQPELRKITTEALEAKGEAAKAKAALEAARQYGIVPPEVNTTDPNATPPRAPGSPDPSQYVSRTDFDKLQYEAGTGLAVMNDLNAEHFKLFGSPVPNMQSLIDEVSRERKLGHTADIRSVWAKSHNVDAKRAEMVAADQKKHDDGIRAEVAKEFAEKHGNNPNLRVGQVSRFSSYDPSKMPNDAKPWQKPAGMSRANNAPWRSDSTSKIATALQK